jgi:asparagine synthase (glutamine-hydrolysing)
LKSFFSEGVRVELAGLDSMLVLEHQLPESFPTWEHFNQAEYLETTYFLPGYILSSQADRTAMANSVEGRYPFLDHRVVAFAAALPHTLKMKVLNQKYLLKQAADGLIPDSIRNRYKQPYRAPDGKSFFASRPGFFLEMLSPDRIRQDGIFDAQSVLALVNKFESGQANSAKDNMALVGILSTQILLQQFTHEKRGRSSCDHLSYEKCAPSL